MNLTSADTIKIAPDRQRQDFDPIKMQELMDSIATNQLMHPPVLRMVGRELHLVAGERRFRAMTSMHELGIPFKHAGQPVPEGQIPWTNIGDLTDLQAEECELDENLKRVDLTWQEHAAAVARLHKLRQTQRDHENTQRSPGTTVLPKHTIADTALEISGKSEGAYQDAIRKEILVSGHLDNPLVSKAKSADEAFKILKRQEESAKNVELARTVGATFNADLHKLLNVNCLDFMQSLVDSPTEHFDVILTDPPYGIGADSFGDAGGKLTGIEHRYDDSYESWAKLMAEWTRLSYQIAKPQAHAYVFCDIDMFHELRDMMRFAGWYVFRTPLINHKLNSGRVPLPDQGPRRQYEIILYAIKGKKQTTHIYPDVISTSPDENFSHGAQKSVALYQNLLQRSVRPGDRVLDTFAGSGTIFEAAHGFKVYATGTELNPEYYGQCLNRLSRLKQLEEPALF